MSHIIILNQAFEQTGIISAWQSLSWVDRWNAEGEFELSVDCGARNVDKLQKGAIVYLSNERTGVIDYINPSMAAGSNTVTMSGYTLKDIIKKRVTVPPSGQAHDAYTNAYPDVIVRSLITKHIINPTSSARRIEGFSFEEASGLGTRIDFSSRYKMLQEEVYELLAADKLGFTCTVDLQNAAAIFNVRAGVNRTIDQDTNSRALFSLKMGTLDTLEQILDAAAYKNMAYVAGQGEGLAREIITTGETAASGWERDELFVDARDVETTNELYTRGTAKLAEVSGEFTVIGSAGANTHIEYALGDFVSIYSSYSNTWSSAQITEIKDVYEAGSAAKRELTIGTPPITIGEAIKRKLSGLQNILTQ